MYQISSHISKKISREKSGKLKSDGLTDRQGDSEQSKSP